MCVCVCVCVCVCNEIFLEELHLQNQWTINMGLDQVSCMFVSSHVSSL